MWKHLLVIIVVLGLLGSVGAVAVHRAREAEAAKVPPVIRPAIVRASPLAQRDYHVTETFYGLIEAETRVDMAFQIPGRIAHTGDHPSRPVRENDVVETGDVVAVLETERYEAAVDQARAAMNKAKAVMATARAQIDETTAALTDAQNEHGRLKRLHQRGAANQFELDKTALAVQVARAHVDAAKAQLSSGQAAYDEARAAETVAQVNLRDASLRAPMRSTVAAIAVEVGQMIQPGQPVVALIDLTRVKLVLGVVERKVALLEQGQQVQVQVRALTSESTPPEQREQLEKPRVGLVSVVPPAADATTGLFNVEVVLDNPDGLLRPGMVGKATVLLSTRRAVAVPADAVLESGEKLSAFFVDHGFGAGLDVGTMGNLALRVPTTVARRVELEPIGTDKDYYLLAAAPQGLGQLIIEGQTRLRDGQPVTVFEPMANVPTDPVDSLP